MRQADKPLLRRAAAHRAKPLLIAGLAGTLLLGGGRAVAGVPEILAFGDSLTTGFGLPADEAFPKRLEAKLKAEGLNVRVVDAGNSGDTTADGLARLDWALADKPDFVLLELGANDMLRGIDPDTVRANLDAMIAKIQASGAKVLLMGMRSVANWGADYRRRFERIYPELAKAHGVALYPFFLDGVALDPKLNQPDGLHPNRRGVAVLVNRIAPVVAKLIGGRS
ncbi:MAG TPA: arylesterase [Stellaceae bacterium]|nr:arylesterase [Stellaceae bacterium]